MTASSFLSFIDKLSLEAIWLRTISELVSVQICCLLWCKEMLETSGARGMNYRNTECK